MHVSAHPELNTTGLNGGGHRLSRTIERSGARDASESIPTLEANANFENMSGDEAQSPKKAVHEPNDSIKCLLEAFKELNADWVNRLNQVAVDVGEHEELRAVIEDMKARNLLLRKDLPMSECVKEALDKFTEIEAAKRSTAAVVSAACNAFLGRQRSPAITAKDLAISLDTVPKAIRQAVNKEGRQQRWPSDSVVEGSEIFTPATYANSVFNNPTSPFPFCFLLVNGSL
ncbi:hypothetical protein QR680_012731 [Steinernema hermaphroditum]|uniref:Uncharacterized protein n=1 Tax=Steinernema hermaphroditum TaxID=289476 RepID=A0AA39I303_9BILA|nr:hypothetical protein QR680_012731 [Steinernema hermaphroditum]